MARRTSVVSAAFTILLLLPFVAASNRPFLLVVNPDDFISTDPSADPPDDSPEFDDFSPPNPSDDALDPGSWRPVLEPSPADEESINSPIDKLYYSGIRDLLEAATHGDHNEILKASAEIEAAAAEGSPHAQSALGFLYGAGVGRAFSRPKSFLYHSFAAENGNVQSKMVIAYHFYRHQMYENAAKLYSELAGTAIASFLISKEPPLIEPVRIHSGTEENKKDLRKSRGEEDEDFQIIEYQAQKGNSAAMFRIGVMYYYGLRGVRRDQMKALNWFSKAADRGEPRAMELLGEIYTRGSSVERNYTKAFEWLSFASKQQHFPAYNGLGYLYVKGYGVEKNYTKAKECFDKAAENKDAGGFYNLGVLYLKGIGVKRDAATAYKYFLMAVNGGQPKALYQVARLLQKGIGLKKDTQAAASLYKAVAERGPWSSLSRWALESYVKGDVGKALLLYSRMAELGYEVAQSNAAWILDRFGAESMCIGESGFCSNAERHLRAHAFWWQASEQGNEHAALLIGDAYYYGRGTDKDFERAAEAYMHARSQTNAQAMFNLGYMHEHGLGLPLDLHLAKRYYDQALEVDPAAKLPVKLALWSLSIRMNYADSIMVKAIDSLPKIFPGIKKWVDTVVMDEGNATIVALFAVLLTVLYLRERQRRQVVAPQPDNAPN